MALKHKLKMVQDLCLMAADLTLGRYPSFVYGKPLRRGETPPVLCLHNAMPDAFDDWCRYLSDNDIITLGANDYLNRVNGKQPSGDREVLLTFDDGHASIWSVVEPLLHKYGLKATTFLIPGRMPALGSEHARQVRPRMDDVWSDNASLDAVLDPLQKGYSLASWRENQLMHERGVMDFQAHTLHHRLVVISDTILGFVTPTMQDSVHPFELAMLADRPGEAPSADITMAPLGTPIYASASRMSAALACFPAPAVAATCTAHVEQNGGADFFAQPDWQATLEQLARQHHAPPTFETPEQQRDAIAHDLQECRRMIESALPGKQVRHLAYPWGVGSTLSTQLAREAGYQGVYWGRVEQRLANTTDTDPYLLARIGEDFFTLLPGKSRSTLSSILAGKLTRRLNRGSPYLSH